MADGFKQRYEEHMEGRTGADAIARLCLVVALVLVLISFAVVGTSPFLYVLTLVLGIASAVYAVLRMNSRNVAARQAEVEAFFGLFKRSGESRQPRERGERAERPRRSARPRRAAAEQEEAPETGDSQPAEPREEQAAPEKVVVECDSCGQRLSVPGGKGSIRITCPKCQNRFVART